VWSKKKESKYKSSISDVVAQALNKTAGLSAIPVTDDQSVLAKEKLVKHRVLFLFHAPAISASAQSSIVTLVKSGELGLVASHDALRDNKEVRELVGMATMYTDYFDMQEIWSVSPGHPITAGVPERFELNPGQPYITFTVSPDVNMIFKGQSTKDKNLQVGWTREPEKGRTFYFCPDHETYTTYENPTVQKILSNAAFWVAARTR
jgi:trehalose utilization protein